MIKKLVLIGLAVCGGYGGYFGYCRYKATTKQNAFVEAAGDLRQKLLLIDRPIGPEEIRAAVLGFAARAAVEVAPAAIRPLIEPLGPANISRLPAATRTALELASRIPNHRRPRYIVGFSGNFRARHGVAKIDFAYEHYTHFDGATNAAPAAGHAR